MGQRNTSISVPSEEQSGSELARSQLESFGSAHDQGALPRHCRPSHDGRTRGPARQGSDGPLGRSLHQTRGQKIWSWNSKDRPQRALGMLELAVRHGALDHNPVRDVGRIARQRRDVRALTHDDAATLRLEIRRDRTAVAHDLPDLADFLLGSGIRIGETCAVRRHAVDRSAGVLEVNSTVIRTKEQGLMIQERANDAAAVRRLRRGISKPARATPRPFEHHRRPTPSPGPEGFDWVTSHTFRKTVATRLDDAGLSARPIADHLGHARPSLPQDVYLGRKVVASQAATVFEFSSRKVVVRGTDRRQRAQFSRFCAPSGT
jgi:integrase